MVKRSRIRHLLFFGMAVALTAHLWMLHDAMPAGDGGAVLAAGSMAIEAAQTAPAPSGGAGDWGTQFMASTCLAVLMGVAAAPLLASARRKRVMSRDLVPSRVTRGGRALGWPPPVPPPSRVDAGVLLVV